MLTSPVLSVLFAPNTKMSLLYEINKRYYDKLPKRTRSFSPLSRPVTIGFVLFFVAMLTFGGVSNIRIGNTAGGLIFIVFALVFLIGVLFGKPSNPSS